MSGSLDIQIPQEAIRDAVASVIVTLLGDNRDETLRNMIVGVLESKGNFGRKEFDNMVLDGIRARAKDIVEEMLSGEEVNNLIRKAIQERLDGFVEEFVNRFTDDLKTKLGRGY